MRGIVFPGRGKPPGVDIKENRASLGGQFPAIRAEGDGLAVMALRPSRDLFLAKTAGGQGIERVGPRMRSQLGLEETGRVGGRPSDENQNHVGAVASGRSPAFGEAPVVADQRAEAGAAIVEALEGRRRIREMVGLAEGLPSRWREVDLSLHDPRGFARGGERKSVV